MQSFSTNVEDKSTESGFQFVFKCELCGTSYESTFVASNAAKEKELFNDVSRFGGMFSNKATLAGALGGQAYKTPAWNKEHDAALKKATDEAMAERQRLLDEARRDADSLRAKGRKRELRQKGGPNQRRSQKSEAHPTPRRCDPAGRIALRSGRRCY